MTNVVEEPSRKPSREAQGIRKGRFESAMDEVFASFNASISFDRELYAEDIEGSIAHARMLGRQGIISAEEAQRIEAGLRSVRDDIKEGRLQLRDELEDIHINVEEALREKIGDLAGKLHTARSRNDQVILDLRLYLIKQSDELRKRLCEMIGSLSDKAESNLDAIMPGYTHLQRAQPVRLAHHLAAYSEMFRRDWERFTDCRKRIDSMPLGSAALAGTTFEIDRESVAQELGFTNVSANSMDSVSDRDFAVEFVFNCSLVMMHLSRLAEELILWSSQEFGFCSMPEEFCSGSSIMPQKKNPDACELVRAKTGRVYGGLITLLTTLKALPLAYNKDLQEDKEPIFDSVRTVRDSLHIMARVVQGVEFDHTRMLEAASAPDMAATDVAEEMVRQGIAFREAHKRVGAMVRAWTESTAEADGLESLPSPEAMVEARRHTGGTARTRVVEQIRRAREFLERANQ